jgi:hypothetical protein
MKAFLFFICVSATFSLSAGRPDTSKIPAKWKNESVIVLEHFYEAREATIDDSRFRVTNRIVYYIRDKQGLQRLSTFNIPTYIVPGAEMQIGKVYKKNSEVIDLTTKNLVPTHFKVDIGNRRKKSSQYEGESGQKLAIPNLEVGDILEIDYISHVKDFINYVYLNVRYNTIKSEIHYEVNKMSYAAECDMHYKVFNYPSDKVEARPTSLSIEREFVEKSKEETLSDDNYVYPYIIAWKTCGGSLPYSENRPEKNQKYELLDDENAKKAQTHLSYFFFPYAYDLQEASTAGTLNKTLNKKYENITDTAAFLDDLFYLCRELRALNKLNDNDYADDDRAREDRFYVDVFSRVLADFKIPYEVLITQYDYYGKLECENDCMLPHYGIYVPNQKYFLFNPFLCPFPNKIPYNLEAHTFYAYKNYLNYYPGKKKHAKYMFRKSTFPESSVEENFYKSEINVSRTDLSKNSAECAFTAWYGGKNKESFCRKACSNSLIYEKTNNPYRKLLMDHNSEVKPLIFDEKEHNRRLKEFFKEQMSDEGLSTLNLRNCEIGDPALFSTKDPLKLSMTFDAENAFAVMDNYLVFDVHSLMGSQLFYREREEERLNDFYATYVKRYLYKISIAIPQGYKLLQSNNLNRSVKTEAGQVEIKSAVVNDKVEITLVKSYFFRTYPKSKSGEVVKFLNAGTDFYNSKIIFVKA